MQDTDILFAFISCLFVNQTLLRTLEPSNRMVLKPNKETNNKRDIKMIPSILFPFVSELREENVGRTLS